MYCTSGHKTSAIYHVTLYKQSHDINDLPCDTIHIFSTSPPTNPNLGLGEGDVGGGEISIQVVVPKSYIQISPAHTIIQCRQYRPVDTTSTFFLIKWLPRNSCYQMLLFSTTYVDMNQTSQTYYGKLVFNKQVLYLGSMLKRTNVK